jgi:hypothetical protein
MHRKRILGFFLLLATFSNPAFADLEFETVKEKPVGPGMVYSHIVEKTQPWSIHLLQIDLHNPYLIIESVKAKETVAGREPTDTMAKQRDWEGHFVVGAVNADFYEPMMNRPMLRSPRANWSICRLKDFRLWLLPMTISRRSSKSTFGACCWPATPL